MNLKGMQAGFEIIEKAFKGHTVSEYTIQRIQDLQLHKISDEGFKQVCHLLADTKQKPPSTIDYFNEIDQWKKSYFNKSGSRFSDTNESESAFELPPCSICFDTGLCKITHHDDKSFKRLIRCTCKVGSNCTAKMPQWDYALKAVFEKLPLDPSWFDPKIGGRDDELSLSTKLWAKVSEWQVIVKASERYWSERGF